MNEKLIAKLAITVAGIAVFMTGTRIESGLLRWTGIGLVAVAFLLRFIGPKAPPRRDDRSGSGTPA